MKLSDYYKSPSYLEILGVDRKEVVHSQFLAWLFQLDEDVNGNTPIYLLVQYLFKASKIANDNQVDDVELISIETEKGSKDRIDIAIKVKVKNIVYNLIIENKVYSQEHNRQTHRYVAAKQKNTNTLFYYLVSTPNKKTNRSNFPDIHEDFTIINYQGILDFVISVLRYADEQKQFILNEYIKSLSKSWRYYERNNNNDNHNVMALNQEHRELLNEFWDSNKELIILALQAITEDDGFSETVQKEVQDAVEVLKEHQEKQSVKYYLTFNNRKSETFTLVDVVRQVLELTKADDVVHQAIFDYFLNNTNYNSFPLVIEKRSSQYKENVSRYGKKTSFFFKKQGDGVTYACLRNWGINNIDAFQKMLKDKFKIELTSDN